MHPADIFITAFNGIRHARMRSALTMLGIVIGIASVIVLMSIGASAERLILNEVQGIGSNLIFVIPGATKGSRFSSPPSVQGIVVKTLTERDMKALEREGAVRRVAPEVRGQGRVIFENNDASIVYTGVTESFFAIRNFTVARGRVLNDADVRSYSRIAVLGSEIAKTLFGVRDPIGKQIRLRDATFRVVGVLDEKGVGPFGVDQDNGVLVPLSVAQKQLLGIDYYNSISIQANDEYDIEFAVARITRSLRESHGSTDPNKDDFTIRTQEDALALLGSITSVLKLFLTSIAFISLVVGGIGIMNIMLVSVIERTKEIGLRKAIGATDRDIMFQFLTEATLLTVIGGGIGIVLGSGITGAVAIVLKVISPTGWVFLLPPGAIAIACVVAAVTGITFGFYPARAAARRNPIDALRYE